MTSNAADFLRRMAPTQSHALRHEFIAAAKLLEGPDVKPVATEFGCIGTVLYDIPIKYGDKPLGSATVIFYPPEENPNADEPLVTVEYNPNEPTAG